MLTTLSVFILLSVFFIPGASIILACENKPLGFEKLSFYALGVSSAYLVLVSLVLLRYGLFNYITVGMMVLSPAVITNTGLISRGRVCIAIHSPVPAFQCRLNCRHKHKYNHNLQD